MPGTDVVPTPMSAIATILVPLDGVGAGGAGVRLAAGVARRQGARLVVVRFEAWPAGRVFESGSPPTFDAVRVTDTETANDATAHELSVPLKRETVAGDRTQIARALIERANTADLIVVDQVASRPSADGWIMDLFAQLPLLTGRPTVFVPDGVRSSGIGERVMVAWDASRESSRAVSDALPILELASDVTVLNVETSGNPYPTGNAGESRLASYLSRHGIPVTLCKSYIAGASVGETIASRACDARADLLVMGAYGYGRDGQVVLGPATRYLLDHMPVPVLMSY